MNIDSDNFLAIAILTENLYNFAKKDEKTAKTQRKYIEKVIAVLKRTWYDIDKQCV